MKSFIVAGGVVLSVAAALIFAVLFGTLGGALSGWIVGWFFSETILGFVEQLGITGFKMWQIGASLGFLVGFFRSASVK